MSPKSSFSNRNGFMINSKSLKKEIYSAFLESQNEIEILRKEIEILQNRKSSELLKISDYKNDYANRMEIHQEEMNLLKRDLLKAWEFIQKNFKEIKKVELPAFIK